MAFCPAIVVPGACTHARLLACLRLCGSTCAASVSPGQHELPARARSALRARCHCSSAARACRARMRVPCAHVRPPFAPRAARWCQCPARRRLARVTTTHATQHFTEHLTQHLTQHLSQHLATAAQACPTPTTSCCRRASSRTQTRSATAWAPTTSCCPSTRPSEAGGWGGGRSAAQLRRLPCGRPSWRRAAADVFVFVRCARRAGARTTTTTTRAP